MLNIHERRQCGVPVIIIGETGVGKTALVNMLSKLWNHALISEWRAVKGRITKKLHDKSLGMYRTRTNFQGTYISQMSQIQHFHDFIFKDHRISA